jgi:hypothetical protein
MTIILYNNGIIRYNSTIYMVIYGKILVLLYHILNWP